MTGHEGFLVTIIANPADDGPRLVYADWLEERGDIDRATFIRLQIKLAQCEADPKVPKGGAERAGYWMAYHREMQIMRAIGALADRPCNCGLCLTEQTDKLLQDNYRAWMTWPLIALAQPSEVNFHRGFVDGVRCTHASWRDHGPEIVACHPVTSLGLLDIHYVVSVAHVAQSGFTVVQPPTTPWPWCLMECLWPTQEEAIEGWCFLALDWARRKSRLTPPASRPGNRRRSPPRPP